MQPYRKLETRLAVQYQGDPIPDVTCEATEKQLEVNGCGSDSRRIHPHVHTMSVGGLDVLRPGDWIMPVPGGPFCRVDDATFRSYFEVPAAEVPAAPAPLIATPESAPPVTPPAPPPPAPKGEAPK